MRSIKKVAIEALFIALFACLLLFPVSYIVSGKSPLSGNKSAIVPMFLGTALLVGGMHVILELLGANEQWCRSEYSL